MACRRYRKVEGTAIRAVNFAWRTGLAGAVHCCNCEFDYERSMDPVWGIRGGLIDDLFPSRLAGDLYQLEMSPYLVMSLIAGEEGCVLWWILLML